MTLIPPRQALIDGTMQPLAFDTGPGNVLIGMRLLLSKELFAPSHSRVHKRLREDYAAICVNATEDVRSFATFQEVVQRSAIKGEAPAVPLNGALL